MSILSHSKQTIRSKKRVSGSSHLLPKLARSLLAKEASLSLAHGPSLQWPCLALKVYPVWPKRYRANAGSMHPHRLSADPVHAGSSSRRSDWHPDLQSEGWRIYDQTGPDLFQPHPRRRNQPRASQGSECPARSDAGAPGDHRRHHAIRSPIRSWCWRRKIRSSRKAPINFPRPSSTASCSR